MDDTDVRFDPDSPTDDTFRLLVNAVIDTGIFLVDATGRIASWNSGAERLTGFAEAEAVGLPITTLAAGDAPAGRAPHDVWTAGAVFTPDREGVLRRKDGSTFQAAVTTSAVCVKGRRAYAVTIRDVTDRKRVEEAMRDGEHKLAEAQRIAHLGHWERDLRSGRITWSAETYRIFGLPPGEPPPKLPALLQHVHPDDRPVVEEAVTRALRGDATYDLKYRIIGPNGETRFVRSQCEVKRDASGTPHTLFGVVQDVTDQRRVEEALKESEQRHLLALDVAALGTWRQDLLTGIGHMDARTQQLWSFDRAEVRWEDLIARVHPDDRDRLTNKRTASCDPSGGGDYANEFRIVRPDGSVRWLATRARVFFEGEGPARRPTLAIGTTADVTECKRADEAIRRSEELLRRAEAMANVAAWTFDAASETFTCSDQASRICGSRPGPHRLDDWLSAVHPQDRERVQLALREGLAGAPLELEHRLVVDGNIKWVYVRAEPQLDVTGRVHGLIGVGQDVTERRLIEEQLRQAQKLEAVGRLAGGVAHDFNNLLSGISMYSDLLLEGLPRYDRLRGYVAAVQTATQLGARLTGQLLAFSRKAVVAPELLHLNEVVESVSLMLSRLVGEQVALVTALSPALSPVMLDRGRLEQVLMNLAVNARDAMPNGGRLTLETRDVEVPQQQPARDTAVAPGRYVELTVSDTGHGMTDEVKSHIFEPFFTTKDAGRGTGLGLATVFGIVKQAGGHIFVDSWVDQGTRFRILMPAAPLTTPAPAAGQPEAAPPPGKETVLLAEDEAIVRNSARLVLQTQGYEVLEAGNGAEAVRIVDAYAGPIHLLLTDVVMPGMGGRELAEAVRARRPDVKVLYMSGYLDDEVVRHGVLQATDAFLQKPLTRLAVARKVREVLDGRR
jgi:PAS domain S-box-containing protein